MKIVITIDDSNPMFDNDKRSGAHTQVATLLAAVAARFDTDGPFDGPLYDDHLKEVASVEVEGRW